MYMFLESLESPDTYRYNDRKYIIVQKIVHQFISMIVFLNSLKPSVGKELRTIPERPTSIRRSIVCHPCSTRSLS